MTEPMRPGETLEQFNDRVLIEGMPSGLKAAIDRALSHGAGADFIRKYIRALTGGPGARPGGLTYLACEAYIEARTKGGES